MRITGTCVSGFIYISTIIHFNGDLAFTIRRELCCPRLAVIRAEAAFDQGATGNPNITLGESFDRFTECEGDFSGFSGRKGLISSTDIQRRGRGIRCSVVRGERHIPGLVLDRGGHLQVAVIQATQIGSGGVAAVRLHRGHDGHGGGAVGDNKGDFLALLNIGGGAADWGVGHVIAVDVVQTDGDARGGVQSGRIGGRRLIT